VAQRRPGRLTSHEWPGRLWAGRDAVNAPGLESIVGHEGRLDVLCCILDGGPLTVPQISARMGKSARLVRHWLEVLDSFDLVEKLAALDGGEPLYAATLDDHPDWVRTTVARHRRD
jgi:hypothetical protein